MKNTSSDSLNHWYLIVTKYMYKFDIYMYISNNYLYHCEFIVNSSKEILLWLHVYPDAVLGRRTNIYSCLENPNV